MNRFRQWKLKLGEKFIQRIGKRRGPLTPPIQLNYRQIFILPSRFGLGFSVLVFVMTIAALNFNNNLALLLSYLLLALILFSSILAYKNLADIQINKATAEAVFVGETAVFSIPINVDNGFRPVLECWQQTLQSQCNLSPHTSTHLVIRKPALQRGRLELGAWKLQTIWPYGYFRAWSWILPTDYCLVYPAPASQTPALPFTGAQGQQFQTALSGDDELHGLHEYQAGEPLNRIAWRSSARADKLISRESERSQGGEINLNWDLLESAETEQRLSILCAWALQAEKSGLRWSMELPGFQLKTSSGQAHLHQALRQLAIFGKHE